MPLPPTIHHVLVAPPAVTAVAPATGTPLVLSPAVPVARREGVKRPEKSATPPAAASGDALTPTLFHQPWWLDAVTRQRWEEVSVQQQGRTVARLPLYATRKWGVHVFTMPPLTNSLGPALDEGEGSSNSRQLRRMDLMAALIERLPPLHHFGQCFHRGISDVLPFQAAGFRTAPQFTVEVLPQPESTLWQNLRDKTRNVIRKTQQKASVALLDDPEEFTRFYRANLEARGEKSYFDLDLIAPLFNAAQARGSASLRGLRSADGGLIAANLVVNDGARSYYLLSTRRPDHEDNGAVSLLIWDALRAAAAAGRVFDFDGISSNGTARFYAGFGGTVVPRFTAFRSSKRFDALKLGRRVMLAEGYDFFCPT